MADGADVLHAWFDRWNAHDLDGLAPLVTADYVHHTMGGEDLDLGGFRAGFAAVLAGFPDVHYVVEHLVTDGDLAAAYVRATGTHLGSFLGVPAAGATATFRGSYHCRVVGGRISEDWDVFDLLTPVLRLGARIVPG